MLHHFIKKVSGLLLVIGPSAFFLIGALDYDVGSLGQMGPGFLPLTFGLIGLVLGLLIFVTDYQSGITNDVDQNKVTWPVREILFVSLSILFFSLSIEYFGLFFSAFLSVLICTISSGKPFEWRRTVSWSLLLAGTTCIVFIVALGLPLKFFPEWI